MKFRSPCAVTLIRTSLVLLAAIRAAQAAEFKIASPSEYEFIEGEWAVTNCCPPFRYQQVFPAEEFAALGNQPHWIVGFTWRPDQSVTSPLTVQLPDQEVRLSTTEWGPDNLHFQFDDNLGADVTQFYRGPMIAVADAHSGPGPREFYHVDFPAGVTPYLYDPSRGNLLFDVFAWQGESPARADMVADIQTSLYAEPPLATHGNPGGAAIFQFTFVPVTPGDFNRDGDLTHVDIDLLGAHVQSSSRDLNFDLNGDRIVDTADRDLWVQDSNYANTFFGDADLDGSVDFPDFLTLSTGYGKPGGWAQGDFDGNGQVNFPDFLNLSANFGNSRAVGAAVPEPSSVILLLIGLVVFGARVRPKVA